MAVKLSPYQYFGTDANGAPLSGYKVFTYSAGSSTKKTTYQESAGVTPHANPIVLNTLGFPVSPIWLTEGQVYKFVIAAPNDTDPPTGSVRTFDNISGVNDTTVTVDQWVASGLTPTYVSATQFTLAGDQTSAFHVGRRLKTTNSGGTIYSTISVSAFTTLTTITVVNDSGALDSGLSAVSYALLSVVNPSTPISSQTIKGVIEIATDAEAIAGSDTTRAVTSAGLASSKLLAADGYMKFPGGAIIQWGTVTTNASGVGTITFPIAFPTACRSVVGTNQDTTIPLLISIAAPSTTTAAVKTEDNAGAVQAGTSAWLAIGY